MFSYSNFILSNFKRQESYLQLVACQGVEHHVNAGPLGGAQDKWLEGSRAAVANVILLERREPLHQECLLLCRAARCKHLHESSHTLQT